MKRVVADLDLMVRSNSFVKCWTSVIYSILASSEINSLGLEILWCYGLGEVRSGSELGGMV